MHKKKTPKALSMLLILTLLLQAFTAGLTVHAEPAETGGAALLLNGYGITAEAGSIGSDTVEAPAGMTAHIGGQLTVSAVVDGTLTDAYISLRVLPSGGNDDRPFLRQTEQTFYGDMVSSAEYLTDGDGLLTEIRLYCKPLEPGRVYDFIADIRFANGVTPDGAEMTFVPSVWKTGEDEPLLPEDGSAATLINTAAAHWQVNMPAASLGVAHLPDTPDGAAVDLPLYHRPDAGDGAVFNQFTFTSTNMSEANPPLGTLFTTEATLTGRILIPAYMLPEGVTLDSASYADYFTFPDGAPDNIRRTAGTVPVNFGTALGGGYIDGDVECYEVFFTWTITADGEDDLAGHSRAVGLKNWVFVTDDDANRIYSGAGGEADCYAAPILAYAALGFVTADGAEEALDEVGAASIQYITQPTAPELDSRPTLEIPFGKSNTRADKRADANGLFKFNLTGIGNPFKATAAYRAEYLTSLEVIDGFTQTENARQVFGTFPLQSVSTGVYALEALGNVSAQTMMALYKDLTLKVYVTTEADAYAAASWTLLGTHELFVLDGGTQLYKPNAAAEFPLTEEQQNTVTGIKLVYEHAESGESILIPPGFKTTAAPQLRFLDENNEASGTYDNHAVLFFTTVDASGEVNAADCAITRKSDVYYYTRNKSAQNLTKPGLKDGVYYPGDEACYTLSVKNESKNLTLHTSSFILTDYPDAKFTNLGGTVEAIVRVPGTDYEAAVTGVVTEAGGQKQIVFDLKTIAGEPGAVAPGQSVTVSYVLTIPQDAEPGTLSNRFTAELQFEGGAGGSGGWQSEDLTLGGGECVITVKKDVPILSLYKSLQRLAGAGIFQPKDNVRYTLAAENIGRAFTQGDGFTNGRTDFILKDVFQTKNFDLSTIRDVVVRYGAIGGEMTEADASEYTLEIFDEYNGDDDVRSRGLLVTLDRDKFLGANTRVEVSFTVSLGAEGVGDGKLEFPSGAAAAQAENRAYLLLEPSGQVEFDYLGDKAHNANVTVADGENDVVYNKNKTGILTSAVTLTVPRAAGSLGLTKKVMEVKPSGEYTYLRYRLTLTNYAKEPFQLLDTADKQLAQFRDRLPVGQTLVVNNTYKLTTMYTRGGTTYTLPAVSAMNGNAWVLVDEAADAALLGQTIALKPAKWGSIPAGLTGQTANQPVALYENNSLVLEFWTRIPTADVPAAAVHLNSAAFLPMPNNHFTAAGTDKALYGEKLHAGADRDLFTDHDDDADASGWRDLHYLKAQAQVPYESNTVTPSLEKARIGSVTGDTKLSAIKLRPADTKYNPGASVFWQITITNASVTDNVMKEGFRVVDKLPVTLTLDSGFTPVFYRHTDDKTTMLKDCDAPDMTVSPDGRTITWTFGTETIAKGGTISVVFATVTDGNYGTRVNTAYLLLNETQSMYIQGLQKGDYLTAAEGKDLYGIGQEGLRATDYADVYGAFGLRSYKTVTSRDGDRAATSQHGKDTEFISVLPDEPFTYKLTVQTESKNKMVFGNLVVIDALPAPGDTGAIAVKQDRGSEWQPMFAANPNFKAVIGGTTYRPGDGLTVECAFAPAGALTAADWNLEPGGLEWIPWEHTNNGSRNGVQAAYVRFILPADATITAGEKLEVFFDMYAPETAPGDAIAWNSFGYALTADGRTRLRAEPLRVGVRTEYAMLQLKKTFEEVEGRKPSADDVRFTLSAYENERVGKVLYGIAGKNVRQAGDILLQANGETEAFAILPGEYFLFELASPEGFTLGEVKLANGGTVRAENGGYVLTIPGMTGGDDTLVLTAHNRALAPDEPTHTPPPTSPPPTTPVYPRPDPTPRPQPSPAPSPEPWSPNDPDDIIMDGDDNPLGGLNPGGDGWEELDITEEIPLFKPNPQTGDIGIQMIGGVFAAGFLLTALLYLKRRWDNRDEE